MTDVYEVLKLIKKKRKAKPGSTPKGLSGEALIVAVVEFGMRHPGTVEGLS